LQIVGDDVLALFAFRIVAVETAIVLALFAESGRLGETGR
tara:strand:+ start:616 stop:735 length:120 start_codon:yes stop_codon:yes gene_type:complete